MLRITFFVHSCIWSVVLFYNLQICLSKSAYEYRTRSWSVAYPTKETVWQGKDMGRGTRCLESEQERCSRVSNQPLPVSCRIKPSAPHQLPASPQQQLETVPPRTRSCPVDCYMNSCSTIRQPSEHTDEFSFDLWTHPCWLVESGGGRTLIEPRSSSGSSRFQPGDWVQRAAPPSCHVKRPTLYNFPVWDARDFLIKADILMPARLLALES